MKKIGCLGLWHLGCITSACLAHRGFEVIGFDIKKSVVKDLLKGKLPIFEPNLEELVKSNLGKNLYFTSDAQLAVSEKDYVFLALDIPVNNHDRVKLKPFYILFDFVKKYISSKTILVISSQVPVGTCRGLQDQLKKLNKEIPVVYFPENLRLGQAIQTFLQPDRIVIGTDDKKVREQFLKDFDLFKCPILEMNLESAEMSKHTLNAYLATMISFSSEISDFCENIGADATEVIKAIKTDARVSPSAPLTPGIGFAGGTLGRDLQTLKIISKKIDYTPKLIKAVYQVNRERLLYLVEKISNVLGSLSGKKIGLLGLTYKPNTNTLRRSQSLELANLLKKLGAEVRAIDPAINDSGTSINSVNVFQKYDYFFDRLDAIVLMTWWEEFKNLQPKMFAPLLKKRIIFDTRNFLDRKAYEKAGFLYVGIGSSVKKVKV